jgi:two-component system, response regulator YesN
VAELYKLIIIDDEPIIRQGLKTIIDWKKFGITVAGEADNGVDGLQLLMDIKPDVAVVDIKMPGMDGLQVVEAAGKNGLETDFIILSGYSEFQYAQKATEIGVRSYLLKPIEQEDLEKRVISLREQWVTKRKNRELMEESKRLLAERTLMKLLQSEGKAVESDDPAGTEVLSTLLEWPWGSYQLALIAEERRDLTPEEAAWLLATLRAEPEFKKGYVMQAGRYIVLLAPEIHPSDILYGCLQEAKSRFGLDPVLTLGIRVLRLENLELSYQSAMDNMWNKFFYDRLDWVIVPGFPMEKIPYGMGEGAPLEHCAMELAKAVAARDMAPIEAILLEAEQSMVRNGWKEDEIKSGYIGIYSEMVHLLTSSNEQIRGLCPSLKEVVEGINTQTTLQSLREYMKRHLSDIVERWSKDKKNSNLVTILDYIEQNLGSDLKLESLAEKFHYNSSYLGKLFRAQTGESFNAYLDRIRIEKAKQLLAGGEKVYEAAALVGYCNVDYFHVKFKKLTGDTPSTYKKKWELGSIH